MTTDLETLITALYVKIDDELVCDRWRGRPPLLSDSELVCLAVAQALLEVRSEAKRSGSGSSDSASARFSPTGPNAPATTNACGQRCRWSNV